MSTDKIEKCTVLRASKERVWRALSNSKEFGRWFGMKVEGEFSPGARLRAVIVPTTVDEQVAAAQKPHEGTPLEILIEQIEPEQLLSLRWHPSCVDDGDDSAEATTLVTFTLQETPEGVLLTVTESGFDQIPLERRAEAFSRNEGGWAIQMTLIEKYLKHAAG